MKPAMKIAVTWENDFVFQHFGRTAAIKLYQVEEGRIIDARVIYPDGSGHSVLARLLRQLDADLLICGGIGSCARLALAQAGIPVLGGVKGDADEAVEAWLDGLLTFDAEPRCAGHSGSCGGSCTDHGCGSCGHCHG